MAFRPTKNDIVTQFLTLDGTPEGDYDMAQDFSVTEGVFYIQPPPGRAYILSSFITSIEASMIASSDDYANIADGLTNGIDLSVTSDAIPYKSLLPAPIKNNGDLFSTVGDTSIENFPGNNIDLLTSKFISVTSQFTLVGSINERLNVVINDDLSSLESHRVRVFGLSVGPV